MPYTDLYYSSPSSCHNQERSFSVNVVENMDAARTAALNFGTGLLELDLKEVNQISKEFQALQRRIGVNTTSLLWRPESLSTRTISPNADKLSYTNLSLTVVSASRPSSRAKKPSESPTTEIMPFCTDQNASRSARKQPVNAIKPVSHSIELKSQVLTKE